MLSNISDRDVIRIASILIVVGYIALLLFKIPVPDLYTTFLGAVFGYYTAIIRQSLNPSTPQEKLEND